MPVAGDTPEPMLQDGQGDPDMAASPASVHGTGLAEPPTPFEEPEIPEIKAPEIKEPASIQESPEKSGKKNGGHKTALIERPPALPPHVKSEAEKQAESVAGSVEEHQRLRKELDEQQKAEALKKKQDAENKQKQAVETALAKAEQKLAKAKAKAAALQNKLDNKGNKRIRRSLEGEFAEVKDNKASPKPSPKKPAPKRSRAKKAPGSNVKLSPKAKRFAAKAATPKAATPDQPKINKAMEKALAALETLRGLELDDLPLPDSATLTKKLLACTCIRELRNCRFV